MSGKIMGQVWDLDLPTNEQLILLAMADHADHEGQNIWPSIGLLAWKTGYSERTIQRVIKSLIGKNILQVQKRRPGKTTIYCTAFENATLKPKYNAKHTPDTDVTPDTNHVTPTPDTHMSPEPSSKPSTKIKDFASPHGNAAEPLFWQQVLAVVKTEALKVCAGDEDWDLFIAEALVDGGISNDFDHTVNQLSELYESGKIKDGDTRDQIITIAKRELTPPVPPTPPQLPPDVEDKFMAVVEEVREERAKKEATPKKWSLKDHVVKIWGAKNEGMAGALLAQMLGITKRNGKRKEYNFEEPLYDEYELWGFRYWWRATFPDIKDMPTAAETLFERFAQFRGDPEYTQHCGMGKYAVEKLTGQASKTDAPAESEPVASEPEEPKQDRSAEIQAAISALSEQFKA